MAKRLRKAPRKIAEEIVASLGEVPGYINARAQPGRSSAIAASEQGRAARFSQR
jgi:hypothetical protein